MRKFGISGSMSERNTQFPITVDGVTIDLVIQISLLPGNGGKGDFGKLESYLPLQMQQI